MRHASLLSPRIGWLHSAGVVAALVLFSSALAGPKAEETLARLVPIDDAGLRQARAQSFIGGDAPRYLASFATAYLALEEGREGEVNTAIEVFVREKKETSDGLLLFAEVRSRRGDLEEAEALCRRALEADRKNPRAYLALARVLDAAPEGDPRRAESTEVLRAGVDRCFEDPALHLAWADRLLQGGDEKKARKEIKEAQLAGCDTAELQACLGRLFGALGEAEKQEEHWRRSRGLSLKYGPAVTELAGVLARSGRLAEAIEVLYQGTVTVDRPEWQTAVHRDLGFAFLGLGETACARRCLELAQRSDPACGAGAGLSVLDGLDPNLDPAAREAKLLRAALEALPGWDFAGHEDVRRAVRHLAETASR